MRHRKRTIGLRQEAQTARAREAFAELQGATAAAQRLQQMAALPTVQWRGRTLYTLRCAGPFGKGPHTVNVPESLLWSLLDLRHFLCAYHR